MPRLNAVQSRRLVSNAHRRTRGQHPTTRAKALVDLVLTQGPSLDQGAIYTALSNASKQLKDIDARRDHLEPSAKKAAVARKRLRKRR